jgi:hypothetical protein
MANYLGSRDNMSTLYGTSVASQRQRRAPAQSAAGQAEAGLFDAQGLPTRPPRTPQEAIQFQFAAAQAARKMQEQRLGQAINTLKYGMGLALRSSPYSIAAMQTPYLRDMANANLGVQYAQPDYSYFLRSGQNNAGMGQMGGRGPVPTFLGGGPGIPTGPQAGIVGYNPFADNPVYPRTAVPGALPAAQPIPDWETANSMQPRLGESLGRAGDWGEF